MDLPLSSLQDKHRYRLLALLLCFFQLSVSYSENQKISIALLIVHFGLFLFWQPIWSRKQKIDAIPFLIFSLFIGCFVWISPLWFLTLWGGILIVLIESTTMTTRKERFVQFFATAYVILAINLIIIPKIFSITLFENFVGEDYFKELYFLIPLPLLIYSSTPNLQKKQNLDYLRGLIIALITITIAITSVLKMLQSDITYLVSLIEVFIVSGIAIIFLSWIWNPGSGYKGLFFIWNRYLLNIGTPLENYLTELTTLTRDHSDPQTFLKGSMQNFVNLSWVKGLKWHSASGSGELGGKATNPLPITFGDLRLSIYTEKAMSPALIIHTKLLVHILAYFYISKLRERKLSQRAQLEAIYETGSRLTHDMKNVLQSLSTLIGIIESSDDSQSQQVLDLVKRQLPALGERLSLTLDKLASPQHETVTNVDINDWWQRLLDRNSGRKIEFINNVEHEIDVVLEVMDTVADNLLDNARIKRIQENDIDIIVSLKMTEDRFVFAVEDTGWQISPKIADHLFKEAVDSENGLGIGLYQSARQAHKFGYRLYIAENQPGKVKLELTQDIDDANLV